MISVTYRPIAVLTLIVSLIGCSSGGDIDSVFRVRALNLSENSPVQNVAVGDLEFFVNFSIGTSFSGAVPGDLTFEVRGFSPPADLVTPAEDDIILHPAETLTFVADTDYTVVTFGDANNLETLIVQHPSPQAFVLGVSQLRFTNVSSFGSVDVYVTDLDTDLASETPVATLNFRQTTPIIERSSGEFQIRLTDPGTLNVVFDSGAGLLDTAQQLLYVATDTPIAGGSPLRLFQLGDFAVNQNVDIDTPALVRVLQLSPDTQPLDVFANDEMLTQPVLENISFADLTAYTVFPNGAVDLDLTPTGDTSVLLLEDDETFINGLEHTYYLTGLAGALEGRSTSDLARSISSEFSLRVIHGTTLVSNLDFYLLDSGTVIDADTDDLFSNLAPAGISTVASLLPGDFEITLTAPDDTTPILGPVPITFVPGGVYTLALRNSDAGTSVQFLLINDE